MNLTKETFPAIIRQIRHQQKWSVGDMARYLNVSPRTIENWEQGHRVPSNALALINLFSEYPPQ